MIWRVLVGLFITQGFHARSVSFIVTNQEIYGIQRDDERTHVRLPDKHERLLGLDLIRPGLPGQISNSTVNVALKVEQSKYKPTPQSSDVLETDYYDDDDDDDDDDGDDDGDGDDADDADDDDDDDDIDDTGFDMDDDNGYFARSQRSTEGVINVAGDDGDYYEDGAPYEDGDGEVYTAQDLNESLADAGEADMSSKTEAVHVPETQERLPFHQIHQLQPISGDTGKYTASSERVSDRLNIPTHATASRHNKKLYDSLHRPTHDTALSNNKRLTASLNRDVRVTDIGTNKADTPVERDVNYRADTEIASGRDVAGNADGISEENDVVEVKATRDAAISEAHSPSQNASSTPTEEASAVNDLADNGRALETFNVLETNSNKDISNNEGDLESLNALYKKHGSLAVSIDGKKGVLSTDGRQFRQRRNGVGQGRQRVSKNPSKLSTRTTKADGLRTVRQHTASLGAFHNVQKRSIAMANTNVQRRPISGALAAAGSLDRPWRRGKRVAQEKWRESLPGAKLAPVDGDEEPAEWQEITDKDLQDGANARLKDIGRYIGMSLLPCIILVFCCVCFIRDPKGCVVALATGCPCCLLCCPCVRTYTDKYLNAQDIIKSKLNDYMPGVIVQDDGTPVFYEPTKEEMDILMEIIAEINEAKQ